MEQRSGGTWEGQEHPIRRENGRQRWSCRIALCTHAITSLVRSPRTSACGARVNLADYELVQHVAPSKAAGCDQRATAILERGELTDAYFSRQELGALQLTAGVQAGPLVPDAISNSARKHLSDRQLAELGGPVGHYWMLGRVATVF